MKTFPKIEINDYKMTPRETIPFKVRISPNEGSQFIYSNRETPRLINYKQNIGENNITETDETEK